MTDVRVLGPVVVSTDAGPASLRPREAAVVAALALADRPLAAAEIVDVIWSSPPASATGAVRNHVSHLRQTVDGLVSVGSGYRFEPDVRVDARVVEEVAARALAGELDGSATDQATTLSAARAAWRGDAFGELVAHPRVIAAREHLDDMRLVVEEELAAALLDATQNEPAHVLLEQLVVESPRRSRRWSLLALACYRLGMRDAALVASMRANDFRTDAGLVDDEQLVRIFRDDPILLTVTARPVPRRAIPIIGAPVDPRLRRFALVGRDAELQRLDGAIDRGVAPDAPTGSRVVALEGEPGIGKTMVAYRAATSASGRGVLALWSWCDVTPVGPSMMLGRLVQDLVAALGAEHVAELAGPDLPALVDLAPDAVWGAGHTGRSDTSAPPSSDVGVRVLTAAARGRPVVCVVDDVQWAPPATVRVLTELAASDARIALVVVARRHQVPPDLDPVPATTISLGELDADAVGEFLHGALEFEPDADLVELIWLRAGGHPLLLREIVESIEPTATPETVRRLASGPEFPRSVAEAVARRLRELRPSTLRAIEAASVLGSSFSPPLLADMVDLDDGALAEATGAGIIAPETRRGRARFCHELVRAAIYDGLTALMRARFHEAAGRALTSRNVPRWDEVAHHFLASAALDPHRAATACRRAGQEASATFSFDEAAAYHGHAVALFEQMDNTDSAEFVDALIDLGFARFRCGDPTAVDVAMRAVLLARDLGDTDRFARGVTVLCDMSLTSEAGAAAPELVELVDAALAASGDPDRQARLAASASYLFAVSGDWERCRSLYDRVVSSGASELVRAGVLAVASLVLGGPDDLGRRSAAADELELLAESLRDDRIRVAALDVRIGVQFQLGDAGFRETLDRMIEMEAVLSEPGIRWATTFLTASRRHVDGDLVAAEAAATEALHARGSGVADSRRFATYCAQLVALRAEADRLAELVPMLEGLATDQPEAAAWHAVLVASLAVSGDSEQAARGFDRLAEGDFAALPRDFTWTAAMTVLTRGIAASGDAFRARVAYDALGRYSGRMSWSGSCTFGPIDQALGEAATAFGSHEAAAAHFRRAAELAARIDAPRMLLRARAGSRPRLPGTGGDGIVN